MIVYRLLSLMSFIYASTTLAGQYDESNQSISIHGPGPKNGFYNATYSHFVPLKQGACADIADLQPLVLTYYMYSDMVHLVRAEEKNSSVSSVTLVGRPVSFCNEGLSDAPWQYMSTDPGYLVIQEGDEPRATTIEQLSVNFEKAKDSNLEFEIQSSLGYIGKERDCLFFNDRGYKAYQKITEKEFYTHNNTTHNTHQNLRRRS